MFKGACGLPLFRDAKHGSWANERVSRLGGWTSMDEDPITRRGPMRLFGTAPVTVPSQLWAAFENQNSNQVGFFSAASNLTALLLYLLATITASDMRTRI